MTLFDTSKEKFYSSMTNFAHKMANDPSFTPKAICPDTSTALKSNKKQFEEFRQLKNKLDEAA